MEGAVSVLMAVYNDSRFLPLAIDSILSQTVRPFRFLIVDDASTDETPQILRSFRDPRIEWVRLDRNIGQTAALNVGLRRASTPWIARMDADDVAHPERLKEQMEVVEEDPSLRCVGTGIWEFHEDPQVVEIVKMRPQHHADIWAAALRGSGIIHGTMLIHREALLEVGGYNERYRYAADREMVIRFLSRYRAMNIQKPLLGVRRHPGQDSFTRRAGEEYIEIFHRLLCEDGVYSLQEKAILRRSLAFSYLFHARCMKADGQLGSWWKDQVRALRLCPSASIRSALGAVGDRLFPKRIRILLRRDSVS